MDRKRIGNIEVRTIKSYNGDDTTEIVCWYPNIHYGHKHEYEKLEKNGRIYYCKPNNPHFLIHEGCFLNPEGCYTIAFVEECRDEEPDIKSVGSRPFRLSQEDRDAYLQIINYIYESYETDY